MGTGRELADQSWDFIELKYVLAVSAVRAGLAPEPHRHNWTKAITSQTLFIHAGIGSITFFHFGH